MPLEPIEKTEVETPVADPSVDSNDDGQTTLKSGEQDKDATAEQAVEHAGLDFEVLTKEYQDDGKLSDASRKALNDSGVGDAYIDNYFKGLAAQEELFELHVHNIVGGKDSYEKITKWAGARMTEDELKSVNDSLVAGDLSLIKVQLDNLKLRMEQSEGKQGVELQGDTTGLANSGLYFDNEELRRDQASNLYKTSERERQRVAQKAMLSMKAGKI